jgi:hypothetical protein
MPQPLTTLTIEQQFQLKSFETQVEKMSRAQAQQFLVKLYEQMIIRETMYKQFLKHEWGIGPTNWQPPTGELD